jgi:hypothetical protein
MCWFLHQYLLKHVWHPIIADRSVRLSPLTVTTPSDCRVNVVGTAADVKTSCCHTLVLVTSKVCDAPLAVWMVRFAEPIAQADAM